MAEPVAAPTLAERLVADAFTLQGDELAVGGVGVRALARAYGTPLYVYDADLMQQRWRALSDAVAGFARVFYSVKANPNPAVVALFAEAGAGLEVASGKEFAIARESGCDAARILFAGPGKGAAELEMALAAGLGELHLESFEEIATAGAIAARLGRVVPVAIRINPDRAARGGAMRMGGAASAFGFDEELIGEVIAAVAAQPSLSLGGIHLFAGTQILDAEVLLAQWSHGLTLAADLARRLGRPLHRIDLGGGLGIPYHASDATLDLAALAAGASRLRAQAAAEPLIAQAEIVLEPGRYLTGPAGIYLMAVRAAKLSRGQRFLICDGGMHHHLAASGNLGQVIKRDYPIVPASRMRDAQRSVATIVGPLCTPLDTLGRQTAMPELVAGDLIAVLQSGAYGLSSSPTGFLSHPTPAEILVQGGRHRVIRAAG